MEVTLYLYYLNERLFNRDKITSLPYILPGERRQPILGYPILLIVLMVPSVCQELSRIVLEICFLVQIMHAILTAVRPGHPLSFSLARVRLAPRHLLCSDILSCTRTAETVRMP
jgi:hypothetical protein